MSVIRKVATDKFCLDIGASFSVTTRVRAPGPPERVDGMTMGIVEMSQSAPHGGEVHPDGDEILYVITGSISVVGDSAPDQQILLGPGELGLVPAGEWHRVVVNEPTKLIHLTPGPNGDHRPILNDVS